MTTLGKLAEDLPGAAVIGSPDVRIAAIATDSRKVVPGALFVALRGTKTDGHAHVAQAAQLGASAFAVEDRSRVAPDASAIVVGDTRAALSKIAAAFYGHPDRELQIVGVTGTNGKTTTTYFVAAALEAAGIPCARIGTLGATFGERTWALENTTPLALELHALFRELLDAGAGAVAMEVSSHALACNRVDDVAFESAVLTNVTRDHLDFHGTLEAYVAAKRRLFSSTVRCILNLDDPAGQRWAPDLAADGHDVVTYGIDNPRASINAAQLTLYPDGSQFLVGDVRFSLSLAGRFNAANALAAIGVARGFGVADRITAEALAATARVPGRMEAFSGEGFKVIVDYAHTPDALQSVLTAVREGAGGRTIVVFGCGGDRDRGKRPEMGRIAENLADVVIVTSDNPRSEDPAEIAREIVAGAGKRERVVVVLDRRNAIRLAIERALPGDTVVIAGKGHEQNQIVGAEVLPFDDRAEVEASLRRMGRVPTCG
jgi:UDP-N-acetylmuramoyl-L-alanyl-D-glutamate--2,6-diaminopimelate ligase